MIRIEPETSANPLLTSDQWAAANRIIATDYSLHYDLVEARSKIAGITITRLRLWVWPEDGTAPFPTIHHIEEDGTVSLVESADWITAEEWPAWT